MGISFTLTPSFPAVIKTGEFVTIVWSMEENRDGQKLGVYILDLDGLEYRRLEYDLSGQPQPWTGSWKWPVAAGIESGLMRAEFKFWPKGSDVPRITASRDFAVEAVPFTGMMVETIKLPNKYA